MALTNCAKATRWTKPRFLLIRLPLSAAQSAVLKRFASDNGMKLRTVLEFVDEVLYDRAYDFRASIVGFNLPFDNSRLAIKHGSARGKAMFVALHVQAVSAVVETSNPSASPQRSRLFDPVHASAETTGPPWSAQAEDHRPQPAEAFIDLKTIAAALLSRSFSLASLADFLKTPTRKADSGGHGRRLTTKYLGYLMQDVQVTWECYQNLRDRYVLHALEETPLGKILSEASLGKAYLKQMGVRPFREVQPDFPPRLTGLVVSTYFGGRAEVHWRQELRQVLYCDFLSMYPTVCTLMELWQFVIAQGMEWSDSTKKTRVLVSSISLDDLQQPEFWPLLTTIVRVAPQADISPVRAKYDGKSKTIGLNYLTSDSPVWLTLADVITAKLRTGKSAEIIEAIAFSPKEPQLGLRPISIAGNPDCRVDPTKDDFFKRLIDLWTAIKTKLKNSPALNAEALDSEQLALKILANSTSYGIFVELNVADLDAPERLTCYGPSGKGFSVESMKIEEPGNYFHPLLATLITGAARLMLAIAESLCVAKGLDWAFCDTDSMAIAKPDDMDEAEFFERAQSICDWFSPLNPYEKKGSIFKIEDANYPTSSPQTD